jgi:DNA-binding XRE family transcriptional regulator
MRRELKRLRLHNFLTQAEMADKCGVSRNNYAYIEQGNRAGSADFWFTLQKEFNIPFERLDDMRKVERG